MVLESLESFCSMFSNGYLIDDSLNAGLKEFLDLIPAFSEGVFYIVGPLLWHRYPKIVAGLPDPNAAIAIIVMGEYPINIKTKDRSFYDFRLL